MSEVVTFLAPIFEPPPPQSKWEREYRAFLRLLPDLLKTHRGQYVAVHEEKALEFGDDELALASRVWAKFGYTPIHVDLVAEQPRPPERVPHFRVLPPERAP